MSLDTVQFREALAGATYDRKDAEVAAFHVLQAMKALYGFPRSRFTGKRFSMESWKLRFSAIFEQMLLGEDDTDNDSLLMSFEAFDAAMEADKRSQFLIDKFVEEFGAMPKR